MKKIAIFASGSGSNFQAIVECIQKGNLEATISLLVCDKPGAYVVERANATGIPSFVFNPKEFSNKEEYEKEILAKLNSLDVEFVVLAGYMRLIGPTLLKEYQGKMVNVHPSFLPDFPGKDAIGQALDAKAKWTGVTVHFVDDGMDTGPIIIQERVNIDENETHESLQRKIQSVEHKLYPTVLQLLLLQGGIINGKKTRAY